MLMETIYATHNIFDLDKLHRNLRRIIRRALATKVLPDRGGRHITVLIITYLSKTKPCLCDDNICFENERHKLSNKTTLSMYPRRILCDEIRPRHFQNIQETMFGYNTLVSSTKHDVSNCPPKYLYMF